VCLSRKQQDGFAPNLFSEFKRKHLFITTCIEKQCTRSLNICADTSARYSFVQYRFTLWKYQKHCCFEWRKLSLFQCFLYPKAACKAALYLWDLSHAT